MCCLNLSLDHSVHPYSWDTSIKYPKRSQFKNPSNLHKQNQHAYTRQSGHGLPAQVNGRLVPELCRNPSLSDTIATLKRTTPAYTAAQKPPHPPVSMSKRRKDASPPKKLTTYFSSVGLASSQGGSFIQTKPYTAAGVLSLPEPQR